MSDVDGRLKVFAYLNAPNAAQYRAIMAAFLRAREQFRLHLRPAEVMADLPLAPESIDLDLAQLCQWGNLESHPDTAEVSTVEEFLRPRFLYRLTPEGEAAERALAFYREILDQPGELQAAALGDIEELLQELLREAESAEPDAARAHRALKQLFALLDELTGRARTFIGSLQRAIDLQGLDLDRFRGYKETLVEYLERFIRELVLRSGRIGEILQALQEREVERVLELAAERDLADALAPTDEDRLETRRRWRGRWEGLRSWFLARPGDRSQADLLRSRARSAIPSLLTALQAIHDRRLRRSDRHADLLTLARRFADCRSDEEAHRLWRAAFGLTPARHLSVDPHTLEAREARPVPARTSWLEAPPITVSPRLRRTGRHSRRGRLASVIDRSEDKLLLSRLLAEEAHQVEEARRRLATGRRTRLSELGFLEADEFQLFLDLLGEALAAHGSTVSADGTLEILLEPTGCRTLATVRTSTGAITGPDHFLTVVDLAARRERRATG